MSVIGGMLEKKADLLPSVTLQPHQQAVLDSLRHHPGNRLLFHSLGSGKTLTGIAASEQTGEPYTFVSPASLRINTRKELSRFVDDPGKADVKSYSELALGHPIPKDQSLVFDEAHRLRNPESMQSQRAIDLARRAKQTVLLTGTPIVNDPTDLAVPLSILTGHEYTPKDFGERYLGTKRVSPGFFGWLRGVPAGQEPIMTHREELKHLLDGKVDYYAPSQSTVPTNHEDVEVEMHPDQASLYHAMWGKLPWLLRWKLSRNYPLSTDDLRRATSFLVGPRQVGLSTYPFMGDRKDALKAFQTSSKLQEAHKRLLEKFQDPRTKALVFSNFIDAGLTPYLAGLQQSGIPAAVFHGGLSDNERKKLVEDYNSGKLRVALLGPSGAEGLSFKGTQLVQILDPYWNSVRGKQSEGRALRYDSHFDLPEELQNVAVQRYISKLPLGFKDRMLERIGLDRKDNRRAADDYLINMSKRKDKLNEQFIDLLKEVGTHKQAVTKPRQLETSTEVSEQSNSDESKQAAAKPHWVQHVMENYESTAPPHLIFTKSPQEIADASDAEGVAPKGVVSWQRMVNFHRNRGGRRLTDERRQALADAITILSQRIKERKQQPEMYDPQTLLPIKQADYAEGIPSKFDYGDISKLKPGQMLDYVVNKHQARRAGLHYDVRFGNPELGLFSWAARKGVPEPGVKHLAIQQPLHSHSYREFEGDIPEGYGAGSVRKFDEGKVLITKAGPQGIHFTTAHRRFPERFALIPPKNPSKKNWLLINTTKTEPIPYEKVHYTSVPPERAEEVLKNLQPGSSVQAKIDGAASLTKLYKDHFEVLSYRASKTGKPIVHTERVFQNRPEVQIPKDLQGSVFRGELYGERDGKVIPPQQLGGLLNSAVAKSITDQQAQKIKLRNMLFDATQIGNKPVTDTPYANRLATVRDAISRIPLPEQFHAPEEATTPESALNLWNTVKQRKDPYGHEGVVIHPVTGKPMKVKMRDEHDVLIRGYVPGKGKYHGVGIGTLTYTDPKLGPSGKVLGEVGTGFSDELRRDIFNKPDDYIGRIARVIAQEKHPSGALRAPAFLAFHEDYPLITNSNAQTTPTTTLR